MSTVTTTRPIDEGQLNAELGGVGVTSLRVGDEVTVTADVPKTALQAAIDAHVPAEPPPNEVEVVRADLYALLDTLFDLGVI